MTDAERFLADDPPFATPEEFAKVMKERDGEMLDLNAFAREVHTNAVAHGWWKEERSFGEIVALCHSELSEALEEYRAGRPMVWYKCDEFETRPERADKPEGIAVELADCIIRILDWCGKEGVNIADSVTKTTRNIEAKEVNRFGDFIASMHSILSMVYGLPENIASVGFAFIISFVYKWAGKEGVDMDAILRLKHEYNKGRPWRHNGKVI